MSYKVQVGNMTIHVNCICDPQTTYETYYKNIERKIIEDGYVPKTSMDNLITKIVLHFDSDDNYGNYDEETGFGGYGDKFTLEECFRYIEDCGGYVEFDYEC